MEIGMEMYCTSLPHNARHAPAFPDLGEDGVRRELLAPYLTFRFSKALAVNATNPGLGRRVE